MARAVQTILVSKSVAKTRSGAAKVAGKYGRVYTSRETDNYWRFRQRPPEDFKKGGYSTKKVAKGVYKVT
jgi:hypothetical protein